MSFGNKKDRTARLLRVVFLLYQNPRGLKPEDVAQQCEVHVRTTYRDLRALEDELRVPLWEDEGRYAIAPDYFLPPIKLTVQEAMALFLSARLFSKYSDERDRSVESVFLKLASVLPPSVAQHVKDTVAFMAERRQDKTFSRVFEILTQAWAECRRVRIWYPRSSPDGSISEVHERLLDPYFIEPSGVGHACYVIGFDHLTGQVRTFKVERIRDIELTADEYCLPPDWNARDYLGPAWGIVHEDEVEVKVRFSSAVASRVKEAVWHPSQSIEDEGKGLLFTARVAGTAEITPWILSWGADAEVLSPPQLRQHLAEMASRQLRLYVREPNENPMGVSIR